MLQVQRLYLAEISALVHRSVVGGRALVMHQTLIQCWRGCGHHGGIMRRGIIATLSLFPLTVEAHNSIDKRAEEQKAVQTLVRRFKNKGKPNSPQMDSQNENNEADGPGRLLLP